MEYRQLGRTDMDVSTVSFGTGPLGDLFGDVRDDQAMAVVGQAIDSGINFFDTSPYYGSAEERLGRATRGRRRDLIIGTKAGRYGYDDFDFTPQRIRRGLETSLRLLQTDYVDVLQLHDVEFGSMDDILTEGYAELVRLRDSGKCRYIGVTGYALPALRRAMVDTELDVLLTYAHGTLLDDSIRTELLPVAEERGVGLMNAAAVALGLLTHNRNWFRRDLLPDGTSIRHDHPGTPEILESARKMVELCEEAGQDITQIANQYAIQRSGCATTVVGTTRAQHLDAALQAASTPIDEDLLRQLLALRPANPCWESGLPENN